MVTFDEACASAGRRFAAAMARQDEQTVEEAAQAAHWDGGPSIEEIAARIRANRAARSTQTAHERRIAARRGMAWQPVDE